MFGIEFTGGIILKIIKTPVFFIVDVIFVAMGFVLSEMLLFSVSKFNSLFVSMDYQLILNLLFSVFSYMIIMSIGGIYRNSWFNAGLNEYIRLAFCVFLSMLVNIIFSLILSKTELTSTGVGDMIKADILTAIISLMFLAGFRLSAKIIYDTGAKNSPDRDKKKLLIIGAGQACHMLISDIKVNENLNYNIVGIIDDNPSLRNMNVYGYRVFGNRHDIINVCAKHDIDDIIVAIPSAKEDNLQEILKICYLTDCNVKMLPSIDEMLDSTKNISKKIRKVKIEDLLEREPVVLENDKIAEEISGNTILVTGGGGSIGSELCRQIALFKPEKLIILDIYENNAYDLQNELVRKHPELNLVVLIASVRDEERLCDIFETYKPEIIFHAAAHKHVPLMENNPCEAIKNNVFGTYNVAKCASRYGSKKFVMISTDKAVNPTNVMGATKRMCEMIVQSFQTVSKTEFVAVRFGNVLGSNGSVIPLFKRQIEQGGPVTVTHKEITRFFMTIPEAAQLVLQASNYAKGGEIFVLDMGKPVKIYDLAINLIKLSGYKPNVDIDIEVTGLRPGEKLYEELLMNEEGLTKTRHSKIFVGKPVFSDINEIENNLKKLEEVLKTNDNKKIVDTLKQIVPTFVAPEEFNKNAI